MNTDFTYGGTEKVELFFLSVFTNKYPHFENEMLKTGKKKRKGWR